MANGVEVLPWLGNVSDLISVENVRHYARGQVRATQRITMTTQKFCCPSMRQRYDDGSGAERYSERIEPSCDSDHKQGLRDHISAS